MEFFGRKEELRLLEEKYQSEKSELTVIYGRRRVGKSRLIQRFVEDKPLFMKFEGLEGEKTPAQIAGFSRTMGLYVEDAFLSKITFDDWQTVFTYLTDRAIRREKAKHKCILVFDEIQWMAAGRGRLISIIKYFWDNHWKDTNVMLILCGSIASFMVKKVINSKALYGRISQEILLKGMHPGEVAGFFKGKRSRKEMLKYLLVFGGIPKYLEEINLNRSFNQNINALCFSKNGLMINEVERIFYSQFREVQTYKSIIRLLRERMYSLNEISTKLKRSTGGSLSSLMQHLTDAGLAESIIPFGSKWSTKFRKYRLGDEFLSFFYKYMEPNLTLISAAGQPKLFEKISEPGFSTWLGFAFERFCLKNAPLLAGAMGFSDDLLYAAPYFERSAPGFQVDMLMERSDGVIVLCECKYHNEEIGTRIIPEIERKKALFKLPRGKTLETALISC